jgi:tRNA(Ile)-lysidine synthase TilS/MesJ
LPCFGASPFLQWKVVAAHLDPARGRDVARRREILRELCEKWGIKCVSKLSRYTRRAYGRSFEMAGRRERYTHFTRRRRQKDCLHRCRPLADDLVGTQLMTFSEDGA